MGAQGRLVSRVWQTDLANEQIGIHSHKGALQFAFYVNGVEGAEAFLKKKYVQEMHSELGKWLESAP